MGRRNTNLKPEIRNPKRVRRSDRRVFGGAAIRGCRAFTWLSLVLSVALSGCMSKATAQAQARAAFLAGQQQAMERMQMQAQGPTVTFVGDVRRNLVPWTAELTLAKGILAADYFGPGEPKEIVVRRGGREIRIDPNQLLGGADVPLEPRDVIEIRH